MVITWVGFKRGLKYWLGLAAVAAVIVAGIFVTIHFWSPAENKVVVMNDPNTAILAAKVKELEAKSVPTPMTCPAPAVAMVAVAPVVAPVDPNVAILAAKVKKLEAAAATPMPRPTTVVNNITTKKETVGHSADHSLMIPTTALGTRFVTGPNGVRHGFPDSDLGLEDLYIMEKFVTEDGREVPVSRKVMAVVDKMTRCPVIARPSGHVPLVKLEPGEILTPIEIYVGNKPGTDQREYRPIWIIAINTSKK